MAAITLAGTSATGTAAYSISPESHICPSRRAQVRRRTAYECGA
jgi:hypothetical protein